MELKEGLKNLLVEIHDSDNERFELDFVEQIASTTRPELKSQLELFIASELVEFDRSDNSYYLTYEGYEEFERIKLVKEENKYSDSEYRNRLDQSKKEKIKVGVLGITIILISIMVLYGIKPNDKLELAPEILEQVNKDISIKIDSMKELQIIKQINDSWNWSGIIADTILDVNEFGNIIFKSKNNEIYRICPEELMVEKIAVNNEEYENLKEDKDFILDWQMKNLVKLAKSEIGELNEFEKYCLKIPAVISGDYSKKNIGKISFNELISISGDLAFQIKDLEDGEHVKLKIKD